jgi:aminoglycoside/choline kinase family phosphotransferase
MFKCKNASMINDQRLVELLAWVESVVSESLINVEPVSGDASFRRYFRLKFASKAIILMDSPVQKENPQPFIKVNQWWQAVGIPVPRLLASDLERGALLLEDCGNQDFYSSLSLGARQAVSRSAAPDMSSDDRGLYRQALALLTQIQQLTEDDNLANAWVVENYDDAKLLQELMLFDQWFLPEFMPNFGTCLSQNTLSAVYDLLIESALNQPKVLVHRDFHARNLMITTESFKVLDFQDAVWGPVTYDWVSLLRDCYLCWSPAAERRLLTDLYHQEAVLQTAFDQFDAFYKAYEWMGLQRHLKVLGIFTRLWRRDKKTAYLKALPRVLNYAVSVLNHYPELEPLAVCLADKELSERVQSIAQLD